MAERIVINTAALASYATRIQNVINRLNNINTRIRSLYFTGQVSGLYLFVTSNRFSSGISTLNSCKSYINHTVSDFEWIENTFANVDPLNFTQAQAKSLTLNNAQDNKNGSSVNVNTKNIFDELIHLIDSGILPISSVNDLLNSGFLGSASQSEVNVFGSLALLGNSTEEILNNLKSILKIGDKVDLGEEYGVSADLIGYIQSLVDLFNGDMTLADVCAIGDESCSLWTSLKDLLESYVGEFSDAWDIGSAGVDVVGSTFGFFETYIKAFDTEGLSWAGITSNFLDAAKDGVPVVTDVFKFALKIGDVESLLLTDKAGFVKNGELTLGWTPLDVYKAIAKAGIATVSQVFDSIEKYNADGVWTFDDGVDTAIDAALAGIYNIGHELSWGLDDLIYSKLTDIPKSEMSYIEQAAEGYKYLAEQIGQKIGSWFS